MSLMRVAGFLGLFASSWRLLKESVAVLMEAAPGHVDVSEVRDAMVAIDGVETVHHLHAETRV